jgi:hypothetical protein
MVAEGRSKLVLDQARPTTQNPTAGSSDQIHVSDFMMEMSMIRLAACLSYMDEADKKKEVDSMGHGHLLPLQVAAELAATISITPCLFMSPPSPSGGFLVNIPRMSDV